MLAVACDSCSTQHAGAACLLVDAVIIAGRGCSLLAVLLAPLVAILGTLSNVLDTGIGRHFPVTSWGG
jgi:hypothetical protein